MRGKYITVFGGTGFIGRAVVQRLALEGLIIRVPVRSYDHGLFLQSMGHIGQIYLKKVNFDDEQDIEACCDDSDFIINLIGTIYEKKPFLYEKIHIDLPKAIAKNASKKNVKRLIHISALGASVHSKLRYLKTKAYGEIAVLKNYPQAIIMRPSLIYGPHDHFFNKLIEMIRFLPFLPIFGKGNARFQPLFINDLVQAIMITLKQSAMERNIYELGGPRIYTLKGLFNQILEVTHRKRMILSIPYSLSYFIGFLCEMLPNPILTREQVKLLQLDNVINLDNSTIHDLGITPTALESILPRYSSRFNDFG